MSDRIKSLDDFLSLLRGVKKASGGSYMALCPGHDDHQQSLSVTEKEGKILLYCHAGCQLEDILRALGLEAKDLSLDSPKTKTEHREIEAIYKYTDANGKPFEVVRTKPKGFYQRRPDSKGGYINNLKGITPTLYHQDQLSKAIIANDPIFIVEGEKDCDNLWNIGLVSTTNPGGAGKWRDSYSEALRGADLIIIPDNDKPGRDHASQVAKSCYGLARRVQMLELPGDYKDVSDWLSAGNTPEDLEHLVSQATEYHPTAGVVAMHEAGGHADLNAPTALEFPDIAWQGLFQDYRDLVAETTEAANAFHYATFCQVLGCTLGRRLHVYHATKLYPNFYICLVGRSGLTRKDTCWARASDFLWRLHTDTDGEESPPFRIVRGIRSYEGLLDELAGERKVRLIQLGELLSLLAKAKQESIGNIVPQLSELYDCPDLVNPPVHQKMVKCREPFVSIIAGTTQAWLQKALTEREIYGGFANRWLYFFGSPKEAKPNPPKVDSGKRDELVKAINQIRLWAESIQNDEITISEEAKKLFEEYYKDYYRRCQQEGLIPTLIVRIQDFIWKLALLYAAMNLSEVIRAQDLQPTIAVGNYLETSVTEVFRSFSDTRGKQLETKIQDYLKSAGRPVDYRDVYRTFNISAREFSQCVEPLVSLGLIGNSHRRGAGGKSIRMLEIVSRNE
jgi:hypothetical protein